MDITILEAKSNAIFERVNKLYEQSKAFETANTRASERFLAESETIGHAREQFAAVIDDINTARKVLNPTAAPDFQPLMALEDLISHITYKRSKLIEIPAAPTREATTKPYVKLPPIDIPSFDGKAENWPIFHEIFKANIHENKNLSDSQRVQYLMSSLTHNASKLAAGIVPAGENYASLWENLVKKYQDTRALGTYYLNSILDAKPPSNSAASLNAFIEKVSSAVAALKQLQFNDLGDFILLHSVLRKIDSQTAQTFEMHISDKDTPKYDELIEFIKNHVKILERTGGNTQLRPAANTQVQTFSKYRNSTQTFVSREPKTIQEGHITKNFCPRCNKQDHSLLYECPSFKNLPVKERFDFIKAKGGCINCLSTIHQTRKCKSTRTCKVCRKGHHSLLHFETTPLLSQPFTQPSVSIENRENASSTNNQEAVASCSYIHVNRNQRQRDQNFNASMRLRHSNVLLATAQVEAYSDGERPTVIRALIDNGSQNNLITIACCNKLKLNLSPLNNSLIKGVGSTSRPIIGYATLKVRSRINYENAYEINVLAVDSITDNLPTEYVDASTFNYLVDLPLADPTWNIPGSVDLILGAQLFPHLFLGESITRYPVSILKTTLGFVLMGDAHAHGANDPAPISNSFCSFTGSVEHFDLQRFWELEELPEKRHLSVEEAACEALYCSSVSRHVNGKYQVDLPFYKSPTELGHSRATAQRRFFALERKFKVDQALKDKYNKVFLEYIEKGYLTEIPPTLESEDGYFIPHHAVIRQDKSSIRPVLDASAKTSSGLSLNDVLYAGPNLQADLFYLLLNFRLFPVGMSADIEKMYLQINVAEKHRKYLKILFRFDQAEDIRTFQFSSVPFGLKSSPYLAMRTIRQLCSDERDNYPKAAKIAENELYMDDLVTSVLNSTEATVVADELIKLLASGGFNLVKWSSNSKILLEKLPQSHCAAIDLSDNEHFKVLGLEWRPAEDIFCFKTSPCEELCTKRIILSTIARLFDVLGLVSPVILFAKLQIKDLWNAGIGWDEVPPEHIVSMFTKFKEELPLLANLRIARHLHVFEDSQVNIVAFCDASLKAYGCAIYLHVTNSFGDVSVGLVCSKSKIAPSKIVSLARLELCAAVLLSKLVRRVYNSYNARFPMLKIYAFSDSTITLSWIHSSPHRWSIFVANRVAQVQENLDPANFYHISGRENPSDCLSRGLLPSELICHPLWWHGPSWMSESVSSWPLRPFTPSSEPVPELNAKALITTVPEQSPIYVLANRRSSWHKLLRIIVYVLRFAKRLPVSPQIKSSDLDHAEEALMLAVQKVHFHADYTLIKDRNYPSTYYLRKLSPFLDDRGIIRIGGRLSNANLPFEVAHPILLPKKGHVVNLLVDYHHKLNCHAGATLLNSLLKQRYWIISSRNIVRQRVRACNQCFRVSPINPIPKMGDLPDYRVQEAKAFVHTGLDYAGPINITLTRRRGQRSQKAYLCIFVCLITKALHVELASSLSTESFLDAFKRFLSRRGPVSYLYSDHGSNFKGAKVQLDELYNFLSTESYHKTINYELATHRITWKMIPPRAPHFGGIWEASVKSFKTHLYRVVGAQLLTFEELLTILTQIEAILNSRPLCLLSEDPYPEALTPAHFLMSTPLQHLPARDLSEERISLVNRKQLLDSLVQSYWKRWKVEYLHTLQVRQKWCTDSNPVKLGTIVLMHQDDAPPLRWPLGIITEVYPGSDGIIRVALVKTRSGSFKRPVVKLCPLPTQ